MRETDKERERELISFDNVKLGKVSSLVAHFTAPQSGGIFKYLHGYILYIYCKMLHVPKGGGSKIH